MDSQDERKITPKKVFLVICIIGLIAGIMLWASGKTTETYDVGDFRISRDARYTDKTEDLLHDNETCTIKGSEITVTSTNYGLYFSGMIITIVFGIIDGIWVWNYLEDRRFNS